MNAKQLMSLFRRQMTEELGDPTQTMLACGVFAHFLAEHFYQCAHSNGRLLCHSDVISVREFLTEVGIAASDDATPPVKAEPVCRVCFHRHEQETECGVDLGKGGICDCKAEMIA